VTVLDDLLGLLDAAPKLRGARCVGRSEMFDPPPPGSPPAAQVEHAAAAVAVCHGCPALTACRAWWDELARAERPAGVVAGQVSEPGPAERRKARADLHQALDAALCADPTVTNVDHARRIGCHVGTVANARRALETAGRIPHVIRKSGRPRKTLQQNGIPA